MHQTVDRKIKPFHSASRLPDGKTPVSLGSGTVVSILGKGSAAVVYEIDCPRLGIRRAVKVLKPNLSTQALHRFEEEIRVAAQFHHPNIVTIHTVGEWNGLPFIEMEKINGYTLDKFIRQFFPLPFEVCIAAAIHICRALESMHGQTYTLWGKTYWGILHRDLKPANILVSETGEVKLTDFGIASPTMTAGDPNWFEGSLEYAAPEILQGHRADARTDIFSLGTVLYEMVTGTMAFREKNLQELIQLRLRNTFEPVSKLRPKVPHKLSSLISRCMVLSPDHRPQTVTDIREELETILAKTRYTAPDQIIPAFITGGSTRQAIGIRTILSWRGSVIALMTLIATATFFLVRNPKDTSPENQPQTSDPDITQLADVRQPGTGEFKTNSNRERSVRKKTSPASVAAAMSRKATAPTGDLEKLQLRYGTTDTRILFEREVLAKNFRSAEKLIDELPDEFKNSVKGILYRIRIHKARGNTTALRILFNTTSIDDGQYLYEKANFSFERGELDKALSLIGKSMTTPSVLAEASVVEKKGTVLKARILTGIYYLDGQERSRKKALDAWFSVKFRLRNNQDHPDFLLANTNIRLLSHGGT